MKIKKEKQLPFGEVQTELSRQEGNFPSLSVRVGDEFAIFIFSHGHWRPAFTNMIERPNWLPLDRWHYRTIEEIRRDARNILAFSRFSR